MKRSLIAKALLGAATLCGHTFALAAQSIDPWALMSMKPTEAQAFLLEKGFKCENIRAYLPQNNEGVRHITILRCTIENAGPRDCYVVELDISDGTLRKQEVIFRR